MKAVRADFLENMSNFNDEDSTGLLLDELTKAFLLFPKASNDILGTHDLEPRDLAQKAHKAQDHKVHERLTKLMLLVNKRDSETGQFENNGDLQDYSMRNLFSRNADFFDQEQENIAAISEQLGECLKSPVSSESIVRNVAEYASFDGNEKGKNKKWMLYAGIGLVLAVGGYFIYRNMNNASSS